MLSVTRPRGNCRYFEFRSILYLPQLSLCSLTTHLVWNVNVEKEFSYPLVIKDASMIIINSIPKGYIGALDQD